MTYRILAINPGSTSTKFAVYDGENQILSKTLNHSVEELSKFNCIMDQFEMRKNEIENTLKEIYGVKINKDQITKLISAVNEETEKWKKRHLQPMYVFTYADCLYIPIKEIFDML